MYLALIVLPLLGSIISGFFGRKIGVRGAQLITCTCVTITTLLAIIAYFEVGFNNIPVIINLFRWVDSEFMNVTWGFNFDSLTVSMLIPVLIVSSLVHIYSIGYMSHDPHNQRFFSYLSLFTFMMIILVTANNFLLMFVGWEGVGVCSYLLVSFWFTRIAANQSSMSAFLTNRVGDCFLTIGMFAILWSFGNIDYYSVFSLAPYFSENIIIIIGICLLIGAMAKSSQVGLHVWLPLAMEGPTPVSALIHAATMVTAGVYLLMRNSPLIEYSATILILCLWTGAITTVFSSLIGLFQQDIKKVIAYSTMSQLGMMVIAIGLSSYNLALFHLMNHAFYKALLFLGAGAVIHAVADNQDFRKYGGLINYLPLTYSVILIASLSLVAIPFMTGYYSKDLILESAFGKSDYSSIIVYFVATIGAMFTTLYSAKVIYLTFLDSPNGPLINYKKETAAHEGDVYMSTPLIILAVFSIFFGYLSKDIYVGLASGFFSDNSLFIHPNHEIMLDTEFAVPTLFKLLPFLFTLTLFTIYILLSEYYPKLLINFKFSNLGYNIYGFFNQRFMVDHYYNKFIVEGIFILGSQTTVIMDKGSVERFGPYGLENSLNKLSKNIDSLSTGVVTTYALYILVGLISYISVLNFSFVNNSIFILTLLMLFILLKVNINMTSNSDIKILEKGFSYKSLSKHFTLTNILTGICTIIIITLFKWGYSTLLNTDFLHFDIKESLLLGTMGLITRLGIKGFIEDNIIPLIPNSFGHAYMGGDNTLMENDTEKKPSNVFFANSTSDNQTGSSSSQGPRDNSTPANSSTSNSKPYYDLRDDNLTFRAPGYPEGVAIPWQDRRYGDHFTQHKFLVTENSIVFSKAQINYLMEQLDRDNISLNDKQFITALNNVCPRASSNWSNATKDRLIDHLREIKQGLDPGARRFFGTEISTSPENGGGKWKEFRSTEERKAFLTQKMREAYWTPDTSDSESNPTSLPSRREYARAHKWGPNHPFARDARIAHNQSNNATTGNTNNAATGNTDNAATGNTDNATNSEEN